MFRKSGYILIDFHAYISILDVEPPNITCPANQTVATDPNSPNATVTIPPATSVDNSNPVEVNVSSECVNVVHIGVERFVFRVSDDAGNVAECAMFITVEGGHCNEKPKCIKDIDMFLSTGHTFTVSYEF